MFLESLAIFEKPSHLIKNASISLKMLPSRIEIFENASNHILKKKLCVLAAIAALPQ
jgi:hypothetical protein